MANPAAGWLRRLPPPGHVSDSDLLRRYYAAGDQAAFELLVRRHAPLVYRVCLSVVRDPHRAEDATQAVFLVLARKAGTLTGVRSLAGWLARVSYRAANRARRRVAPAALEDVHPAAGPDPCAAAELAERHAAAAEEVTRLPARYRDPLVLCYYDGLTNAAAAARLGWPAGTVAGRLARARRLLRVRLAARGVTLPAAVAAAVPAGFVDCVTAAAPTSSAAVLASEVAFAMTVWNRRLVGCLVSVAAGLTALGVTAQPRPQPPAKPPAHAGPTELAVEGRVLDEFGKVPLSGVKVWASAGSGTLRPTGETTTDADGKFRLTFGPGVSQPGGRVGGLVAIVHAQKPGWYAWTYGWPAAYLLRDEPAAKTQRPPKGYDFLRPGETARIEFRMAPAAAFKLRLVDGSGKPLADTRVWLTGEDLPPGGSVQAQGKTDAAGVWTAADLPRRPFRLVLGDNADPRRELTVGQIDFRNAAEYVAEVTVRAWTVETTDTGFRVTRGRQLTP